MRGKTLVDSASSHYGKRDTARLRKAIDFADQAHHGQKRLSDEDYIEHSLKVAEILLDWRLDVDTVVAGVLHDVIEDTGITLDTIAEQFGHEVAFLVDGVTKVSKARSGMRDISSYLPQTSTNLSKLLIAVCSDLRVLLIKLADRLHNLRTLEHQPKDKQKKIAGESIEVFAPLADRLGIGKLRVEIENLAFSYLEPQEYTRLQTLIKKKLGSSHKYLEKVRRDIGQQLKKEGMEFTLDGRIKSVYSLYKKLKKVDSIDDVHDLLAIRIIVPDKNDCYLVLGVVHDLYQPVLTKIKDYISVPKPNGYQSLHTTVITPYEQIVEIQIRSTDMHAFAERGLAASFHYNDQKLSKAYKRGDTAKLPRNLRWISELQERVQQYMELPEEEHVNLSIDLFKDRIFVYSPKGDIYDLPEGASALDFAFAVHTDVGKHAQGAKINNKMGKLSSTLSNGDIVDIVTVKNVHPTVGWMEFAHTEKARQKIRAYLNKNS